MKKIKQKRRVPLWKIIVDIVFGTGMGIATVTTFIVMMICYYNIEVLGNLNLILFLLTAASTIAFVILATNVIQEIFIRDVYYNDYMVKKDDDKNE